MRNLVIASLAFLVGCAGQPSTSGPSFEAWDSAGIQIVQSNRSLDESREGWSVSEAPAFQISSDPVNPDGILHWIRDVARLSDGRIAVISGSDKNLRFFSGEGDVLGIVGRDGDGPGEFRDPFQLIRHAGDTLVVRERAGGRISWFSPEGQFLRSLSPDRDLVVAAAPPEYPFVHQFLTIPPSQALWVAADRGEILYNQKFRIRGSIFLAGIDGSTPRYLGPYAGREQFFLREGVGRFSFFGPDTYFAAGGEPLRIYLGDSNSFEIHVFNSAGAHIRIIRDAIQPAEIESRDIEWERWELLDFMEGFGLTDPYTELADEMPLPSQKPAFEDLVVDSEGFLWAKEYSSYRPDPIRYRIFSPEGVRVATVRLPGRFRVFDIGLDYVLGVHSDLDYIETIQLYSLTRPTGEDLNFR